jgi:hypothetical protein
MQTMTTVTAPNGYTYRDRTRAGWAVAYVEQITHALAPAHMITPATVDACWAAAARCLVMAGA